ncbi:hypothetical protein DID78_03805 [Candidatus Marinamargulisbacteria bacterium SCGC AG-343-D04]|nr:hypothetical protein DID78_03805 [Candidatus Marinamargulisbacteria bacterium SCGC AG-343-D04]
MKFSYSVVLICLLFSFSIEVRANSSANISKSQQGNSNVSKEFEIHFSQDLTQLSLFLQNNEYGSSIDILNKLMGKVKVKQGEFLQAFFPKKFQGFYKKESYIPLSDSGIEEAGYSVYFNQAYENKKGHVLKVNIIHSDELIKDYQELVKKPSLIENMENTALVRMESYNAITTFSEESKLYEQTILLNEDFMMTCIVIGSKNASVLSDFINSIDLQKLESYLAKN